VRGRKKRREMFFIHTWRLSCTPNSPFSYEGGLASENRCSGFDVDLKQRIANESRDSGHWILVLSHGKRYMHTGACFLFPSYISVHVLKQALNRGSHDNMPDEC
jgi:hypothetical protein